MGRFTKLHKLQNQARQLWVDICYLRDGEVCAVEKHYPHINTKHTEKYQVDHCFSQKIKRLFLEIANGTVVCDACNLNKNHSDAVRMAVYDIVKEREGSVFDRMRGEVEQGGPFPEWRRIRWLKDKISVLEEIKECYQKGIF